MQADALHRVETPEYVIFEFELAGLASRAVAWAIDAFIILLLVILAFTVASFAGVVSEGAAFALSAVLVFVIQWGYHAAFEWAWRGQTPGKRAVGLRVLQDTGVPIGFYQAMLRNLLRILDSLPVTYLLGALVLVTNRRAQRLGDMLAGTIVVRERKRPVPSAIVPPSERYNTFLEDRRTHAAARAAITPELREIMTSLALRREEIELEGRLELFRRIADYLVEQGVPRPRALSDERFVLNATAAALDPA